MQLISMHPPVGPGPDSPAPLAPDSLAPLAPDSPAPLAPEGAATAGALTDVTKSISLLNTLGISFVAQ